MTDRSRPRTALVIDDSRLVVDLVCDILAAAQWTCLRAYDGAGGLELLHTHRPDVILCDLHMPGLGGLGVLRHLRQREELIPVVILSLDDDLLAVRTAIREGAFDYVIKTGDEDAIRAAVHRAAEHHDRLKAAQRSRAQLE